jgi:riboflavin synthase
MFTGIVEELGRVRAITHAGGGARLEIACAEVLDDAAMGDSIAVNGCCLTVVELGDGWWAADAQVETLDRTTLGALAPDDPVNLERPMRLGDRLGGHLVLGHVDGVGDVVKVEYQADGSSRITVRAPVELARYFVEKGSVTVDGVSLTITTVSDAEFGVALIPHTLAVTTLGVRNAGDRVNLEADMIAKHVARAVERAIASGTAERAVME